jgi:hypothetical protein
MTDWMPLLRNAAGQELKLYQEILKKNLEVELNVNEL